MSKFSTLGEQKEVRLTQGVIRYRESGSGEPILFIHGFLANGDLWRKVVPSLAKNFRCIAPDWPLGAHEIGLEEGANLTPPALARLIADFMAALELSEVTLVGNDSGGALSQLVITTYPQRIKRLVLTNCDAYQNFPPPAVRFFLWPGWIPGGVFLMGKLFKLNPAARLAMKFVTKYPVEQAVLQSYLQTSLDDKAVRRDVGKFLRGMSNRYTKAAATKFSEFKKPVLLVWAVEDRLFTIKDAEKLVQDFPDARLERIEDSSTFIPEDQPQQLVKHIEAFMGATVKV